MRHAHQCDPAFRARIAERPVLQPGEPDQRQHQSRHGRHTQSRCDQSGHRADVACLDRRPVTVRRAPGGPAGLGPRRHTVDRRRHAGRAPAGVRWPADRRLLRRPRLPGRAGPARVGFPVRGRVVRRHGGAGQAPRHGRVAEPADRARAAAVRDHRSGRLSHPGRDARHPRRADHRRRTDFRRPGHTAPGHAEGECGLSRGVQSGGGDLLRGAERGGPWRTGGRHRHEAPDRSPGPRGGTGRCDRLPPAGGGDQPRPSAGTVGVQGLHLAAGGGGFRAHVTEVVGIASTTIPRDAVRPSVTFLEVP